MNDEDKKMIDEMYETMEYHALGIAVLYRQMFDEFIDVGFTHEDAIKFLEKIRIGEL